MSDKLLKYDVFISYRRNEAGQPLSRLLAEHLRDKGLEVFYDEDTIKGGKFNQAIYQSIDKSNNFIIVLTKDCLDRCKNEEDWVRLEFEHALKKAEEEELNIIPVFTGEFEWPVDDSDLVKACPMIKVLKYYNGRKINYENFNESINSIIELFNKREILNQKEKRIDNRYLDISDNDYIENEIERLHHQRKLLDNFDKKIVSDLISSFDSPAILDLGCSDCNYIMSRISDLDKVSLFVGVDSNAQSLEHAKENFSRDKFYFEQIDLMDSLSLTNRLKDILKSNHKESFDIINLSMILLHINKPYDLVKTVYPFLSEEGYIIVKEIDDGFNIAYPDDDNSFKRVFEICSRNEKSGYRKCGREVYDILVKFFDSRDISLEKLCVSTVGMNKAQRRDLFDIYFSFILADLKDMVEKYPFDKRYRSDYEWYSANYNELERRFISEDFFFSLGFMLYTAKNT